MKCRVAIIHHYSPEYYADLINPAMKDFYLCGENEIPENVTLYVYSHDKLPDDEEVIDRLIRDKYWNGISSAYKEYLYDIEVLMEEHDIIGA